jgi:hypothetical protein
MSCPAGRTYQQVERRLSRLRREVLPGRQDLQLSTFAGAERFYPVTEHGVSAQLCELSSLLNAVYNASLATFPSLEASGRSRQSSS